MAEKCILELEDSKEQFDLGHARLVRMLGHIVPLDITIQAGMKPENGRVYLGATLATDEAGATITKTEEYYTVTDEENVAYAVDRLKSVISLHEDGVAVVEIREPFEHQASGSWHDDRTTELADDELARSLQDIYTGIDAFRVQSDADLQRQTS
jgi:hypothetical protein